MNAGIGKLCPGPSRGTLFNAASIFAVVESRRYPESYANLKKKKHFFMDRKVWKFIIVYYQKSSERAKLQNSMKPVSTVSPANFKHRLRTSLEGIATLSFAHPKNESGRLKIINIANVNTNTTNETRSHKFNTRNFSTPIFVTKSTILYKRSKYYQRQPETIKSQPP